MNLGPARGLLNMRLGQGGLIFSQDASVPHWVH
jgi:hypothetical protein